MSIPPTYNTSNRRELPVLPPSAPPKKLPPIPQPKGSTSLSKLEKKPSVVAASALSAASTHQGQSTPNKFIPPRSNTTVQSDSKAKQNVTPGKTSNRPLPSIAFGENGSLKKAAPKTLPPVPERKRPVENILPKPAAIHQTNFRKVDGGNTSHPSGKCPPIIVEQMSEAELAEIKSTFEAYVKVTKEYDDLKKQISTEREIIAALYNEEISKNKKNLDNQKICEQLANKLKKIANDDTERKEIKNSLHDAIFLQRMNSNKTWLNELKNHRDVQELLIEIEYFYIKNLLQKIETTKESDKTQDERELEPFLSQYVHERNVHTLAGVSLIFGFEDTYALKHLIKLDGSIIIHPEERYIIISNFGMEQIVNISKKIKNFTPDFTVCGPNKSKMEILFIKKLKEKNQF